MNVKVSTTKKVSVLTRKKNKKEIMKRKEK